MSQFTHISGTGTTTTLVSPALSMLNGLDTAGQIMSLAFHDCAATGDVAAGNKVWESNAESMMTGHIQQFAGVMFRKGIVAVVTTPAPEAEFKLNIEWE